MEELICVSDLKKKFTIYESKQAGGSKHKSIWNRKKVEREVLHGLDFSISKGEIVGFLGPNGAGKSTAIKILTGILYPTSGSASVLGYTPWERKIAYRKQIAVVMGQKSQLWLDLPASESFELCKNIYEIDDGQYHKTLSKFTEILNVGHVMNVQVRRLSLGERMKMELIAALLHEPKVIFLDEPTIGLDLQAQKSIRTFIQEYNQEYGATIMLTSHQIQDIEALCQRSIIINKGNIVYDGVLSEANAVVSGKKLLTLQLRDMPSDAELMNLGKIRRYDKTKVTLEVEREKARETLIAAVNAFDAIDFEMQDVPLEETLELLYAMEGAHEQ